MFERELDYYVITANTECITATERIVDKSTALASRVYKAKRDFEAAKSDHEYFLLALECCNQFCQGCGGRVSVVIPRDHKLSHLYLRNKLFSEFLDHYFDLILETNEIHIHCRVGGYAFNVRKKKM
jgi:hypothetical protein